MATIKGRVVDYDNDNPLAGVTVEGLTKDGEVFYNTTTDQGGRFTASDPGFDNMYSKIRFSKDNYATQTMRPDSANNVDIPLPKAGVLGTVTIIAKQNKSILIAIAIVLLLVIAYYSIFKSKSK